MTQTTTDYLFQIAVPPADRSFNSGSSSTAGRFDDHLSQASTVAADDSRDPNVNSLRADSARYDGDDNSWNARDAEPAPRENEYKSPTKTSESDQVESPAGSCNTKPSADDAHDEHDSDKSDDELAIESAGANQAARDTSPKTDPKAAPNADAKSAATTKINELNKKPESHSESQANKHQSLPDSTAQAVDTAAKLEVITKTDASAALDGAEQPQAAVTGDIQAKDETSSGAKAKSKTGARTTEDVVTTGKPSAKLADGGEITPEATQQVSDNPQATLSLAAPTVAKGAPDSDKSADDDSRRGSRDDARAGTRNEAAAQVNKVDAAQLVNAAANAIDSDANVPAKTGSNEHATKPTAATSETPLAAFARLARTNNGAADSGQTAGTNDLPRIDPSRFVGRVAKAFQTAQDRGGTLQLRLSPPELGALHLELTVKDGVMSAKLQTENATARRLLLDHLPMLRDRLAEQNIRVDRFDVDVRRDGTGGQADTRGSQQQQFQHQPDQPAPRRQANILQQARESSTPDILPVPPTVSDAGLNLIV